MSKVLKTIVGIALTAITFIPGIGTALGVGLKVIQAVRAIGIATALSGASEILFGPKMPKSQLGRLNVTLETTAPRKAVFGTTAMNLDLRYHEASGTDQEYIDYVIALAAHKVKSIDQIWFEEKLAWSATGGVTSTYTGYLTVNTITEGSASSYFTINGGSRWGASQRLTGCAQVHIRIKRTGNTKEAESPLVSGMPSRVTIIGDGAPLYDPRKDSTVAGGSGSHRTNDQSTWGAYTNADDTDNPALQLLWFLLGWRINGELSIGCGVPANRIDLPSFITAANICDETVTMASGTQKRYRTSGTAADSDDRMSVINTFLSSMNGTLRDSGGKLSLTVIKNDLANYVLTFDESDVLDDFEWNQTRGLNDTYTKVRGRYVDPSDNSLYQLVDYPEIEVAGGALDGIDRVMTLDLGYVEDGRRAQRIAKQALQRNQYKGMFSATFTAKAQGCTVGDVVRLTFPALGWSNKLFRVVSQEIRFDGQVPLVLIEENAAIYAWDASDTAPVTPNAPTIYDPLNNPIVRAITDAEAAADGKIVSFFQTTPPTAGEIGDIWFDTDDANKMYRWNGTSWVLARDTGITTAISAASTAQATADGKVKSYFQASPPTASAVGDLWFDTDDNNKLYRWGGSSWNLARDGGITVAINTAEDAIAVADGKINTYFQTTPPAAGAVGDIWFDTDDANKMYRWSGSAWVLARDTDITNAINAASDAQATADGKVVTFFQATEPTAEAIGDLWFDTDDGNKLYRWGGFSWNLARDGGIMVAIETAEDALAVADGKINTYFQTTAPTAGAVGDIWFDTDDANKMYRWSGSAWTLARDTGITSAINLASDAQATADGKVTSFFQPTSPTAEAVGDLWFDTDDNNKLYRWSGTAWVLSTDNRVTNGFDGSGNINTDKVITNSITNGAVTNTSVAYSASSVDITTNLVAGTWTQVQSVSVSATANSTVLIRSNVKAQTDLVRNNTAGTVGMFARIKENGSLVAGGDADNQIYYPSSTTDMTIGIRSPLPILRAIPISTSGTYTYTLEVTNGVLGNVSNNNKISGAYLEAMVVKK